MPGRVIAGTLAKPPGIIFRRLLIHNKTLTKLSGLPLSA